MEDSRIPNKLRRYRRLHGYSQKRVARMLGLADISTLSRWEHGHTIPGSLHLFRLARLYGTMPHELFDGLWNQIVQEAGLLAHEEPLISNETIYL